jgi:Spy/CpxP family protein refolding chaperone
MRPDTLKATVLLVFSALAGAAGGSIITSQRHSHDRPGSHSHHGSDWYIELLEDELELTEVQEDSLRAVLSRHRQKIDAMYAELGPRMDAMRDTIRADVRRLLTPGQQQRYQAVTARLDRERQDKNQRDSVTP